MKRRGVITHWKFYRLERLLNLPRYQVLGVLVMLWDFATENAPDGDLSQCDASAIASHMEWGGDSARLVAALVEAGWLDRDGGRLVVHDWEENQPGLAQRVHRERRRERERTSGGRHTHAEWMERVRLFGWACAYCGVKLTVATLTKDHILPVSRGGASWPENLAPACRSCNCRKGARLWTPVLVVGGT